MPCGFWPKRCANSHPKPEKEGPDGDAPPPGPVNINFWEPTLKTNHTPVIIHLRDFLALPDDHRHTEGNTVYVKSAQGRMVPARIIP